MAPLNAGTYERFEQRNILEQQVEHGKMKQKEADNIMQQVLAREVQQREAMEQKKNEQAAEHR